MARWWEVEPEENFWERQKRSFEQFVQQRMQEAQRILQQPSLPDVGGAVSSVAEALPAIPLPQIDVGRLVGARAPEPGGVPIARGTATDISEVPSFALTRERPTPPALPSPIALPRESPEDAAFRQRFQQREAEREALTRAIQRQQAEARIARDVEAEQALPEPLRLGADVRRVFAEREAFRQSLPPAQRRLLDPDSPLAAIDMGLRLANITPALVAQSVIDLSKGRAPRYAEVSAALASNPGLADAVAAYLSGRELPPSVEVPGAGAAYTALTGQRLRRPEEVVSGVLQRGELPTIPEIATTALDVLANPKTGGLELAEEAVRRGAPPALRGLGRLSRAAERRGLAPGLSIEDVARTGGEVPPGVTPRAEAPEATVPGQAAPETGAVPEEVAPPAQPPSPPEPLTGPPPEGVPVSEPSPAPQRQRVPIWMRNYVQPEQVTLPPPRTPAEPPPAGGPPTPPPRLPSGRAPGGPGRLPPGGMVSRPTTPVRERALANPTPTLRERVSNAVGRIIRATYDRLYPLRELDALAGLDPNAGSHASAQVVSGAYAAGEDIVMREVLPKLDRIAGDEDHLEWYMTLRSYEDLLRRNPNAAGPGGMHGMSDLRRELQALRDELGPERFSAIEAVANELWDVNDRYRLQELRRMGRLSAEQYRNIKADNPHYIPFDRYDYTAEDGAHLLPPAHRPEASVTGAGLPRRELAGSTKALDQPLARFIADLINTQQVKFRNEAARALVDALRQSEQRTGRRAVSVMTEQEARRAGITSTRDFGLISFYDPANPGVKMVAQVPKIYETVAKGLEAAPAGALANFLKVIGAAPVLRAGATTLNVAFLPVNIIRDIANAAFREGLKVTPLHPNYWRGLAAAIAKNTDFSEAARAGVLSSGLLESMRAQDVLKSARRFRRRGALQVQSARDALLLLPRLVRDVGEGIRTAAEVTEQAPRIGTFLKLKAEGLSDLEAAVRARDVTVDFSKSGDFVRVLNQITPFLNARIQGGANTIRAIRDNPARLLTIGAPFVMGSIFAYAWNRRFETADLIPLYEWDRNWVFIIGEGEEAPDPRFPNQPPRKFPIYVKIPKGDAAAVLTAPAEALIRIATQQGDRSWTEHLFHGFVAATQGLSPLDPSVSGVLSVVGVPTVETGIEIATNRNLFSGRQIVPEGELTRPPEAQFGPETSRTAVLLGEQFKVSPRLIDHAIRGVTAGLGQEAIWLADLALKALGYEPGVPGEARRQQPTPVEQLAQVPGVSRFLGVRATEPERVAAERLQRQLEEDRRTLYQNPEFRRFGLGVNPVPESVTVDGQPMRLPPDVRLERQRQSTALTKQALDALITTDYYKNQPSDREKLRLIDAVRTVIQNRSRDAAIAQLRGRPAPAVTFDVQEFIQARQLQEQWDAIPKYLNPYTGKPLGQREQKLIDYFRDQIEREAGRLRLDAQRQMRVLELNDAQNRAIRTEAARRVLQRFPQYRTAIALAAVAGKLYNPQRRAFWIQHSRLLSRYYAEPTDETPEEAAARAG